MLKLPHNIPANTTSTLTGGVISDLNNLRSSLLCSHNSVITYINTLPA